MDIFTEEELTNMRHTALKTLCEERSLQKERSKVACVASILEWQERHPDGAVTDDDNDEDNDEENVNAGREDDGDVQAEVPQVGRKRTRVVNIEDRQIQGIDKRQKVSNLDDRLLTKAQLDEILVQHQSNRMGADVEARVEIRKMLVKKTADEYFPDLELKKLKLQHEYNALRDIGRAFMEYEEAETEVERVELASRVKRLLTARAATIVTADKEGWSVAQFVEPESKSFLQDTKALVKEARSKFKKGDQSYRRRNGSGGTRSNTRVNGNITTTSANSNGFFRNSTPAGSRSTTRTGTPSGFKPPGAKKTIQCYTCRGPHLQRDCPQRR
jgi:hypothetical protein